MEERIWHASQKLERLSDGRLDLCMEVGGAPDVRTWILSFGSGAEVLEPARLRDDVVAELRDALERYALRAPARGPRRRRAAAG